MDILEEKLDRLIALRLTDSIDIDRYNAKKGDIETRLILARIQYSEDDANKSTLIAKFDQAAQFMLAPGDFWRTASPADRQRAFGLFFKGSVKLSWRGDKKIRTIRVDGSNYPMWLPRLDSNQRPAD